MPKSPGEEFLLEKGLLTRSSPAQQLVIGCLACRWNASRTSDDAPAAYITRVSRCTGLQSASVIKILRRLKTIGVLTSERESLETAIRRQPRLYYRPADSELGADFAACLEEEVPPVCNFEQASRTATPNKAGRLSRDSRVAEIINTSSREELESIIAQATHRIEQIGQP